MGFQHPLRWWTGEASLHECQYHAWPGARVGFGAFLVPDFGHFPLENDGHPPAYIYIYTGYHSISKCMYIYIYNEDTFFCTQQKCRIW